MEDLKQKIKRLRKEKRLSQTELAELAGISRVAYTYFENGTTDKLSLDAAKGLAKALDVSFNDLFSVEYRNIEAEAMKAKIETLLNQIDQLEEKTKLIGDVYGSSYVLQDISTIELEKLKGIFTLMDLFQFIDKGRFSEEFNFLVKPGSLQNCFSLDVIISFYNLYGEDSKNFIVDFIDFKALKKSPDLLKKAGFNLNAKEWDKKKIIEELIRLKGISDLVSEDS